MCICSFIATLFILVKYVSVCLSVRPCVCMYVCTISHQSALATYLWLLRSVAKCILNASQIYKIRSLLCLVKRSNIIDSHPVSNPLSASIPSARDQPVMLILLPAAVLKIMLKNKNCA